MRIFAGQQVFIIVFLCCTIGEARLHTHRRQRTTGEELLPMLAAAELPAGFDLDARPRSGDAFGGLARLFLVRFFVVVGYAIKIKTF